MTVDAQTGETGQTDDTAGSSSAGENTQATESTEQAETSAGTENTDTQAGMVPSGRLREEAEKRRAAERELEEAREKLQALEQRDTASTGQAGNGEAHTDDEPPPNLDARARARWIVEHDTKRYIEHELGMPLADAKTILTSSVSATNEQAKRTWREGCKKHGLDPESKEIVRVVRGLVKEGGFTFEDAMTKAEKLYGQATSGQGGQTETTSASVETTGHTGTMSADRIVPRNPKHAQELAEKGVTIAHQSLDELIGAAVEEENKRIGPNRVRAID